MGLMRQLLCGLRRHSPGRFCAYCGQQREWSQLTVYRVRSTCTLSLDKTVEAVNERHACMLAAHGWHPDNLEVVALDDSEVRSAGR
jgi:hypothetical protein